MGGDYETRGVTNARPSRGVICRHDELTARRIDLVTSGAIGQYLRRLERRAIRGHDLTGSCQLQRLTRAEAGELEAARGQFQCLRAGAELDVLTSLRLRGRLDVRDADGGGLVRAGPGGGEDDLLTRGGAPLSRQRLRGHHA